jgi:hypothetical protein
VVLVVVVGAVVVVVVVGAAVVVVVVLVVVLVVVVVVQGAREPVIKFVHSPVEVIVITVAVSFTLTTNPFSKLVLVAVFGDGVPTFVVRLKLGPRPAPNDVSNNDIL